MQGANDIVYSIMRWVRRSTRLFPLATDLLAWPIGLAAGLPLRLATDLDGVWAEYALMSALAMLVQAAIGTRLGVYRRQWRYSSFEEVSAVATTWFLTTIVVLVTNAFFRRAEGLPRDLPTSAVLIGAIVALCLIGSSRLAWRVYWEHHHRPDRHRAKRTVVFGAGEAGTRMVKAMQADPMSKYAPVALLDDNPHIANRRVSGVRVEGTRRDLRHVAERHDAEVLLVAVPGADSILIQELACVANELELEIRVLPTTSELMGKLTISDARPPTVDDLLGRDPVEIDLESVSKYLKGRRVLITGAGGSIGSELSRQVASFEPSHLFLLDRDETALHSLQLGLEGRALLDSDQLIVADIRDRDRIFEVMEKCRPSVVFHTAALKHLTLLERHPEEGIKTNVFGTKNVLDASMAVHVERFVNISTDKAANPTSVLGATKLAAERFTNQAAATADGIYVSVRFGNVLGSRGSVLPTFLQQLEKGVPLTVTHPEATRFFMTIPEASRLVVQAAAIGDSGEILILDMGQPVSIADLARALIDRLRPGTPIEYTGLRPGEKLHEELLAVDETGVARVHPRIIHCASTPQDPLDALGKIGANRVGFVDDYGRYVSFDSPSATEPAKR